MDIIVEQVVHIRIGGWTGWSMSGVLCVVGICRFVGGSLDAGSTMLWLAICAIVTTAIA